MKHLLKRFLAMVLVICTIATMVMPAYAEGETTGTDPSAALSLSAKLDSENKQIAVTVSLEEGTNLTGAQARLNYDSKVVKFNSFESKDLLPNGADEDIAYDSGSYVELIFGGWASSAEDAVTTTESAVLGTVIFDITDTTAKKADFSLANGRCTDYEAAAGFDAKLGDSVSVTIRYDITAENQEQDLGSYTVDKTDAMPGETVTVTTSPKTGYEVNTVTANGEKATAGENGTYTFVMPEQDVTVSVSFQAKTYGITVAEVENGEVAVTVNGESAEKAPTEATITLTLTPKAGYSAESPEVTYQAFGEEGREETVTVEVTAVEGKDNTYTFTMPAGDVTVKAAFTANTYAILTEVEHGTITLIPESVNEAKVAKTDETVSFIVTADTGYQVAKVTMNGEVLTAGENGEYTFTMPGKIANVVATTTPETHKITVTQPANGEIKVNDSAATDEEVTITVTPKDGYSVTEVTVTGAEVTKVSDTKYTFTMPASDVTVSATSEANTYNITKAETEHGTFEVASSAKTDEDVAITVVPAEGYMVDQVTVTGADVTKVDDTTYTFKMPAQDVTVSVTFELKQYQVEIADTVNGTAKADKTNVAAGTEVTITAAPADGYEVDSVTVAGVDGFTEVSVTDKGDGTYTFKMPTQDVTVTVTFVEKSYQITTAASSNGTVTVDKNTAKAGETVTVTVTANSGYVVGGVSVNAEGVTVTDQGNGKYTFVMPAQAVTVSAQFKAIRKVTLASFTNGAVSVDPTSATAGEIITVTATPDTNYVVESVTVSNGAEVTTVNDTEYTFVMPDEDVTVTVKFTDKTFAVNVTAGANGTAEANLKVAAKGATVTVTATPDEGYVVDQITVKTASGKTVEVKDNTFVMPAESVTITVTFTEKTYQITTAAVSNGTVKVDKNTAKAGETVTVTVTANTGYLVTAVTVNAEGVTVTDKGNGTYTFVMPARDIMVSASYQVENPFVDVKSSDWFYPYVLEAYNRGLMNGTGDSKFEPYGTTTRAMFVQILYAMAGKPEVTINNPFVDVSDTAWYAKAVQWAYENKVTGGTSDTTFSPEEPVTREQIALFLYAYAGRPEVTGDLAGFADASKVSSWAKTAVIWATQNGIISGSDDNGTIYLNPGKSASRAETATMMVGFAKFLEK